MRQLPLLLPGLNLILFLAGCSGSSPAPQNINVSVSPMTVNVPVSQKQTFAATVNGTTDTAVSWSVAGGSANGTITSGGVYTAPPTVPSPAQVTVTATSNADASKFGSAIVTVTNPSSSTVAVSPSAVSVEVFTTQQFSATINGQPSSAVTWQVNGVTGGNTITGTISSSGLYSAPHSISNSIIPSGNAPVTVQITAISTANTSNSGIATVTLTVPNQRAENPPTIELGTSGSNANDSVTSGGKITCCGGTLGSLVVRGGTQYILSNDHVLARSGAGSLGDPIIQPGLIDTGTCTSQGATTVAHLTQQSFNLQNPSSATIDAAIAQVAVGTVDPLGEIFLLGNAVDANGVPVPGAPQAGSGQAASVNLAVAKSGRTTGLTCSTVNAVNASTSVMYATNCDGSGTKFTVIYNNQISVLGGDFSGAGDSGSLIVTQSNANPVALLYGGSNMDTVGNPVSDVLSFFASGGNTVSFVGGNRGPGVGQQVIGCTLPGPQAAMTARLAIQKVLPSSESLTLAERVRDLHAEELMAHPEVQAVGVGASYDNPAESAILVFVTRGQQRTNIPAVVDGVRTRIIEAELFTTRGVLSAEDSATAEQSAAPPQAVYSITNAEYTRALTAHSAHVEEWMKQPGVQGFGITSSVDSPGEAALMIFLIRGVAHPVIPPVIDGVRTRVRESSRFRAGFGDAPGQHPCTIPATRKTQQKLAPESRVRP